MRSEENMLSLSCPQKPAGIPACYALRNVGLRGVGGGGGQTEDEGVGATAREGLGRSRYTICGA